MNDETRDDGLVEENAETTDATADARADEADAAAGLVGELQEEVEGLQEALTSALGRIAELEASPVEAAAPAGDAELRALAVTIRTAQRNGHPDAAKHLDTLLRALGA